MSRGPIPDKPRSRPSVAELQPLINAYYQFPGCGVGGDLHIVLDDRNWADHHIQWCIEHAGEWGDREPEGARLLGRLLLLTTRTQRRRLGSGYAGPPMDRAVFLARCRALLNRAAVRQEKKDDEDVSRKAVTSARVHAHAWARIVDWGADGCLWCVVCGAIQLDSWRTPRLPTGAPAVRQEPKT